MRKEEEKMEISLFVNLKEMFMAWLQMRVDPG